MGLEMVLNDLSSTPLAEDEWAARQRMERFVEMLRVAVSLKVERVLRTENGLNAVELAPSYPIARWLNDSEVDQETRRYLRRLATNGPYLKDIIDPEVQNDFELSDFFHEDRKASGLGVAFLLDLLAISFRSHFIWEVSLLSLTVTQLRGNEIQNSIVPIKHASCKDHILEHRDWIKKRTQVDIQSGLDLHQHRWVAQVR